MEAHPASETKGLWSPRAVSINAPSLRLDLDVVRGAEQVGREAAHAKRRAIAGHLERIRDTEVFKCASRNTRRRRDGDSLLEEISEIIGLQVYTQNGVFLGNVNNLVVDVDNGAVDGIFVGETNPLLVEGSRAVSVPYRWVQSVGDIVILRHFPKRVTTKKAPAAVPAVK